MSASTKTVPRHIAIIMDGNGRWARARGLPRIKGHEAGAQAVRECVEGCGELKVEYLTLYAFSAENWQRPKGEVHSLMRLLEKFLKEKTPELIDKAMIDVEMFSKHLYTRYYPDPDLLIRTSGEMRLSNFLLWQLSYTEIYVTPKLWPDFTKKDLFAAVEEYGLRQRRYGAVD